MTAHEYLSGLFSLEGKVALVTGGSSGIGKAIATALGRAGAQVIIVARDKDRLAETTLELRGNGCEVRWIAADLGERDAVAEVAGEAREVWGRGPDILVNCAGVNLRPPVDGLAEVWDATMAVNLVAPFLLGQAFGPEMAGRGYGRIIHISSQQPHRAFANSGAYGVSKGALESLARSQAEAWSPYGVTCNTLVPGFVPTALNTRLSSDPEQVAALAARTLVGRNGRVDDFAGAAVFLASPAAGYITGQSIFVDGGFSAH
ncbi:SDR family NAD(P)-dependent oxidoreductase [Nocardia crassostreae]|uniref:SDR family NAD(P)-dependent oxidoreductase n=1 Tax=Nocardia crassostreae TaxID=53428 RepID=UPI00082CD408|nr:SDR family oxidoreductase [Nocardia crassostreae]